MAVYKHKKTGRWVAQVRDPSTGRKKQIGTYDTKGKARAAEQSAGATLHSAMTVAEWRDHWLATDKWKESTRRHNSERTKRFADTHGDKRLAAIKRPLARDWVAEQPSSLNALSAMFGAAEYEDDEFGNRLLPSNPFSKLVKRTTKKRDLQDEWLTDADVDDLEDKARFALADPTGELIASMIRVAAETGVRPGELFALTEDSVDRARHRLTITAAVDSHSNTVGTPKNGQSREVVLSARAIAAIDAAPRFADNEWLFQSPSGRRFVGESFRHYWRQVRAAAGRPDMDFYELRHYCATRLLEAGVSDRDVAVQLGHANEQLVRDVYGHPSKRRALDRVQESLNNDQGDNDHESRKAADRRTA